MTEAEMGVMLPWLKGCQEFLEAWRGRKDSPLETSEEAQSCGNTLIVDVRPVEL